MKVIEFGRFAVWKQDRRQIVAHHFNQPVAQTKPHIPRNSKKSLETPVNPLRWATKAPFTEV